MYIIESLTGLSPWVDWSHKASSINNRLADLLLLEAL